METFAYVEYNSLTNVPREISLLSSLVDLVLGYNMLSELPTEIGSINKLTRFEVLFHVSKFNVCLENKF